MDRQTKHHHSFSHSTLFNLEPLMNFQLPHEDDDDNFDYYGNSSPDDERRDTQGGRANHNNGNVHTREGNLLRKRAWSQNNDTDDEEKGRYYETHMTEERYRSMLGDHVQKYKRRRKDAMSNPAQNRVAVPLVKSNNGLKVRKSGNDYRGASHAAESVSEWLHDSSNQITGNNSHADIKQRIMYEPACLEIGDDIAYKIPQIYDTLAPMLNLPNFSEIHLEEIYLKGTLDLGSLATMMAADKRFGTRNRAGMGEPLSPYESLQERIKAMSASSSPHKFSLKVSDVDLNSSIPEGATGSIKRSILSEGGVLQVYYVKVLEKGDTYEIVERSLPKKQKVKKDPALIEKEEMNRIGKIWINIVKRDIPKHHRNFTNFHRKQLIDAKRFTEYCQREVKMKVSRSLKWIKGANIRTRKLARDMLLFWKRVDKEMAEVRKREEKEAAEALKHEQELREAKRQQQRLNFLIQQTELYSHFMQNKSSVHSSDASPLVDEKTNDQDALFDCSDAGHNEEEDPEEAELKKEALKAAQEAVSKQRSLTNAFDSECLRLRQEGELTQQVAGASNIDLQTPSTMPVVSTVQTPELFKGCLKEYQLKGLQWLVNCYEQGLNGILADEMGLGKTIQAMVFLAHLAEEKNIWGPFLVVAPASVLNNWNEELERFCPDLKRLPYWGGLSERTVLRKSINPKDLYRREAKFHILITSYQLLVTDEKYFRRVKWQYMVLDEAQAIKSSTSIRWKTLLSFNCRNRLLLTGTPVQNNMAELWALLHFIMPTLFDSHEQFNEWFSKGIENHAEHGGTLNEHQLSRLHSILKPFMLRRIKKDVVSELTKKTEVMVHCKLSSRQQAFYQAIKNKISLAGLFDSNRGQLNDKKVMNLMNIVIQLRKVCNHPELFERNEGSTYFYFGEIPNSLPPPPFGELEDIYYPGGHNPVSYEIPKLVYQEIMQSSKNFNSAVGHGICRESLQKRFNIFTPENVHRSIFSEDIIVKSGNFGFTHLMDLSPQEVAFMATGSFMERLLFSMMRWEQKFIDEVLDFLIDTTIDDPECSHLEKGKVRAVSRMLLLPSRYETKLLQKKFATGPTHDPFEALVVSHQDRLLSNARLLHSAYTYIPPARAPPIHAHCSDRNFSYKMIEELHDPWLKRLLVGFARTSECNGPRMPDNSPHLIEEIDSELSISRPALKLTHSIFGSSPPVRNFDPAKLLTDSKKLQTLDILEDYMNYRKYKYFRLDGSSTIQDRRDMVTDFQHRSDIFVFLLSTRAGGLGINLTAADTVIFYESDWNPTLDLQAMDRAHRLGQTKDVTVYRLICKETVEEKILLRASQKSTVQNLVMTGGSVGGDMLAPEDVVSLLLDDVQLQQKLKEIPPQGKQKKKPMKAIRISEEGDASLEDLTNCLAQETADHDISLDLEGPKSNNKKADLNQAISMVSYYASSSEPAMVRGKTVYIQYSNRHEIVNNKSPGDIPGNVLLVTIEGVEAGDVSIDVIHLVFSAFGFVHKIATFEKTAGFQALIQFTDAETASAARDALDGRSIPRYLLPAHVGSCNLRISYSAHKDLNIKFQSNRSRDYTNPMLPVNYTAIEGAVQTAVGPDGKRKEPESNVLLASIENMQYAVTVDVLHTVFSAFGTVQKIAIFEKNGQTQALIQYPDIVTAAAAREALEGHCIYDGGYCKLHLSYSRHTDLNVKAFSDKSRDYTVPDPSLLAAQGPPTAWQNPQAAPMYPGSGHAFPTQVPGGQVPSWDPSLQAVRPSYVSAPGTYPVQTGAVPPMPGYAPGAMPAASSPLAQSSPIAHNANPMGISQPGGASPLMQTSQAAQGLAQPNARPGGASPPGQNYYG